MINWELSALEKIFWIAITALSIYCLFLVFKDIVIGTKSLFRWIRATLNDVKEYIVEFWIWPFAVLFLVGFFKLIIFIRESVVLSGIIWIIIWGFWLIVVIIAYLFGMNKIINQYKGIEPDFEGIEIKGDIRWTIFAIIFVTFIWGFFAFLIWSEIDRILSIM